MAKVSKKLQQVQHHKKALLAALEKTLGVVSEACKIAELDRTTFYNYQKEDAEFAAAVKDIQEISLDFAESKLFQLIDGVWLEGKGEDQNEPPTYKLPPNVTATIFYLKTKGKDRGYVEKQEIQHSGSIQQKPAHDLSKLSPEELDAFEKLLEKTNA